MFEWKTKMQMQYLNIANQLLLSKKWIPKNFLYIMAKSLLLKIPIIPSI